MSRITLFIISTLFLFIISCTSETDKLEKEIIIMGDEIPTSPYSPGVKIGNTLYVSGQIAIDPSTGTLIEGGIEDQTWQALENLKAIVEKAGFSMRDIVKCNVLLDTISFYGPMNEIYRTYFPDMPPARKAYSVESLPLGALVEIDAIAVKQ